jgi:hypothetical protein
MTLVPRVSICVPNFNARPFLPDRFHSILDQRFEDWELLVYDSCSDDGSWEYITQLAAIEPRLVCWQGPREGVPAGWNACLQPARGDYVYIATSDDTMPDDCLGKLVAALDAHPECDIAHCRLRMFDEDGSDRPDWWAERSVFARSSGRLIDHPHVRRAPHDGLLHLSGETVYTSMTQLLIRRSLFDRVGLFDRMWQSVTDFNWTMRASLVASTVHVPDTWGGWRVHAAQATAASGLGTREHARMTDRMIDHAIRSAAEGVGPALARRLEERWSPQARDYRAFALEIKARPNSMARRAFIARRLIAGSAAARSHLWAHLFNRPNWLESFPEVVERWLREAGLGPSLVPLRSCARQPAA